MTQPYESIVAGGEHPLQESALTTIFTLAAYSLASRGRLGRGWEPLFHG